MKGVKNDSWASGFNNEVIHFANRGKSEKDPIWKLGGGQGWRVWSSIGRKCDTRNEDTLIVDVQSIL